MYYRVTCENLGVYEYLKKYIFETSKSPFDDWKYFLSLDCNRWLNNPKVYNDINKKYFSYFTEIGYSRFINSTFLEIKKIVGDQKFKVDVVDLVNSEIVYEDENQVVVLNNM